MSEETEPRLYQLSWMGLRLPIQKDWRPLRIEGAHERGSITIGDQDGPVFQLRWIRPPADHDNEGWIERRRIAVAGGQSSTNPPQPEDFGTVGWIENLEIREECEKTVWWGCARDGSVLVEILLTGLRSSKLNQWFLTRSLPELSVARADEPWMWEIYSAHFIVPAGYHLTRHRLATGDMAFEFFRGGQERLLVRQVYPAGLALQRRSLTGWLRDRAFKESRRMRIDQEDQEDDRRLKWSGSKRLPFPLGPLSPRQWEAVIVQDANTDRLLIAEREWRKGNQGPSADEIAKAMQWGSS